MTYDHSRAACTRAAILATLLKEVRAADTAVRAEVLDGLAVGDRLNGVLPSGALAGRVRVDPGSVTAYVEDERALLAHVQATAPDEVETTVRVRPAYLGKLLDAVKAAGELPPGVGVRAGDPKVVVTVSAADRAAITAAWADGSLSLADLVRPALPAADGEAA